MKLVCEKYKESMDSETAACHHPDDYCSTRSSCMINFMEKERKREEKAAQEKDVKEV